MPIIKRQRVDITNLQYIGFQNSRRCDSADARGKTVGFFLRDEKFEHVCHRPWDYRDWLAQYKQVMSLDLSCFTDMALEEQWMSVYRSRLAGALWQYFGLTVIPTVSWSSEGSYGFCFAGLVRGSIVAVSTIGTSSSRDCFMDGFRELCRVIEPEAVICYCNPYPEMYRYAEIISITHEGKAAWRRAKLRHIPRQLKLFEDVDGQCLFGFKPAQADDKNYQEV